MIHISYCDLDKFKRISSGKFGIVYQVNDSVAYKIYHRKLYDNYSGNYFTNPSLKGYRRRLHRLSIKKRKISNTDLFDDYIYINGKFGGIKIPYYNGNILFNLMDEPFELKYDISKKLLKNSMELTNNYVYPLDYKLNNIIYVDNDVKIIDLDDIFTKSTYFRNVYHERNSICVLNDTIRSFFGEFSFKPFDREISNKLLVEKSHITTNYQDINDFLDIRNKDKDFLLINKNSNLDIVTNLLKNHDYKVIYLFDLFDSKCFDNDYYNNIILSLREKGILLYDFVSLPYVDKYLNNTKTNNIVEINYDKILQKK